MEAWVAAGEDAVFELCVQLATHGCIPAPRTGDPPKEVMAAEYCDLQWDEAASPYVKVGTLTLPASPEADLSRELPWSPLQFNACNTLAPDDPPAGQTCRAESTPTRRTPRCGSPTPTERTRARGSASHVGQGRHTVLRTKRSSGASGRPILCSHVRPLRQRRPAATGHAFEATRVLRFAQSMSADSREKRQRRIRRCAACPRAEQAV